MSSYYGGKPGEAFNIVKTFASIEEMVNLFKQGPGYNDVNFDEYVLINTVNKNNPENGQLFRRGYDYQTTEPIKNYKEIISTDGKKIYTETSVISGGAIYVGTIVGPAGRAPLLNLGLYEDLNAAGESVHITETDLDLAHSEENPLQDVAIIAALNEKYPKGLNVYGDGKKRDYNSIEVLVGEEPRWFCCDNFIWKAQNDYGTPSGWFRVENAPSIGEDKYTVTNASLVPGVTYETDVNGDFVYDKPEEEKGRQHLKPIGYQDSIDWRYVTVRNENYEDSTAFIGFRFAAPVIEFEAEAVDAYYNRNDAEQSLDYDNINLITPVSTDTVVEGKTVKHPFYSKWDVKVPKGIKGDCISNIRVVPNEKESLDKLKMAKLDNNGKLVYNNNRTELVLEDYTDSDDITNGRAIIVCDYTSYDRVPEGDTGTIFLGDYNMIDNITFTKEGTLTIDYSHDDTDEYFEWITWLTGLTLDKETGKWVTTFNNQTQDNAKNTEQYLTWVKKIEMSDNGSITYTHTTSENDRTDEKVVNWIDTFTFDKETGKLTVKFNNDNLTDFEHTLNYIKDIQLRPEDNHIIVTHSDPEKYDNGVQDLGSIRHIMVGPEGTDTSDLATHGIWFVTE